MIPRVPPRLAARMAVVSGCATVKVKVGDPDGEERVRAVREAVGPGVRIRVDANGAWGVDEAIARARPGLPAYDLEMVEDPVAALSTSMARAPPPAAPVPVAAEMAIR